MPHEPPTASIVVTCKGRLHHLIHTLPTMLAQGGLEFGHEVVVVDYGCPNGTFDWLQSLDDRRLLAVKVLDQVDAFNAARARNCGAKHATGRILAFVDADIRLTEGWLAAVSSPILRGDAGLVQAAVPLSGWDVAGTCAVSAELFHRVRGYDECYVGWGGEDLDFYRRCGRHAEVGIYSASLSSPIRHDDRQRLRFSSASSLAESAEANAARKRAVKSALNPKGFGVAEFQLFRGEGLATVHAWRNPRVAALRVRRPRS